MSGETEVRTECWPSVQSSRTHECFHSFQVQGCHLCQVVDGEQRVLFTPKKNGMRSIHHREPLIRTLCLQMPALQFRQIRHCHDLASLQILRHPVFQKLRIVRVTVAF